MIQKTFIQPGDPPRVGMICTLTLLILSVHVTAQRTGPPPTGTPQHEWIQSIQPPTGFLRSPVAPGSFGEYLRNLPLKIGNSTVYLYNGEPKLNQSAQFAVVDMDVGNRDLQQCADAIIRLRAEYLYRNGRYDEIRFAFARDGRPRYYTHYCRGDYSRGKFRSYLNWIFAYANTASLNGELQPVAPTADLQIGDVFIQTGRPYGHAVIVVDLARHPKTGQKVFLLAQGFMPAQQIHVLKNPGYPNLNPWYPVDFGETLITPEWTFTKQDHRRFWE